MANIETTITVSTEAAVMNALKDIIRMAYKDHGVQILNVDASWVEYVGKGNNVLLDVEFRMKG